MEFQNPSSTFANMLNDTLTILNGPMLVLERIRFRFDSVTRGSVESS